jgi:outer membrane protein OmpA-like peptidoglycan-associated protein
MFCTSFVVAQNLVPDPGFENVRKLPVRKSNPISCTKNWLCPTNGAGDYYHHDALRRASTPHNVFGRQKPHSGDAYGGICVRKNFIEYLETKLSDTLIKDREYLVEFYISRAERSIGSVKEFGALFRKKTIVGAPGIGLPVEPSVEVVRPGKYRSKRKWMKFSAVYLAEGNETVLILGYFNHEKLKKFKGVAHYYIDDVSVILLEEKTAPVASAEPAIKTEPVANTAPIKIGETITLKNIFFNTGKSELLPASFPELDKLAGYLNEMPNTLIAISGHTDNTGNEDQNQKLSEARAKAVADYLTEKGIDTSRINYTGYGSSRPVSSNDSEEGKQQNRRVEFVVNEK